MLRTASPNIRSQRAGILAWLVLVLLSGSLLSSLPVTGGEIDSMNEGWPGCSILGNGRLCIVYSDDVRVSPGIRREGILHLHYSSFEADYINSTSFDILDAEGNALEEDSSLDRSVGLVNFCTVRSKKYLRDESQPADPIGIEIRAGVHPKDAVILSYAVKRALEGGHFLFRARIPERIITDTVIELIRAESRGSEAVFEWSNGTTIVIGTLDGSGGVVLEKGGMVIGGSARAGRIQVVISVGESEEEALQRLYDLRTDQSPLETVREHWQSWLYSGLVPEFGDDEILEAFSRNLYAAKSSCVNGQIPADVTGQFVTNGMPQLYPRDALMTARVFMLTGHLDQARQVLEFWADPAIPKKSPGEWYARYDAHGKAVDAGTGARYDEPEWDSNGYFIILANQYHEATGEWPASPRFLVELADFLVEHIDENGLLYEGGIVEWTGYLPATNMVAASALEVLSKVELDPELQADLDWARRCSGYRATSKSIGESLKDLFDSSREIYADLRFAARKGDDNRSLPYHTGEKLYLWDTSANFGIIWGFPDHRRMQSTNRFYAQNCVKLGGGMQYFDSPDPGLAGYGHDLFFFTTAAAAQYHALYGDHSRSKMHIDWMLENANIYGLMPERIHLDQSGCSAASPLSWCCAEFAAALVEYEKANGE
jgi:hypothetical protein